ncbi:putative leucine-rich repeat domain superfamily [Helianthus debilis subsp. tardiflorus]
MNDYLEHYDCFEFDQIILHLSRNHPVKKLILEGLNGTDNFWYKLPNSVFALHHLTDLYLSFFYIDHPSIFNGFRSLRKLDLSDIQISTQTLLHLLSNCPSLKNLSLYIWEPGDTCTISELLKCLPVIEDLTMSGNVSEWLVLDSVPQELPISLIHLKYLCLSQMCLVERYGSALLLCMLKCSPNLERMYLEMENGLEFSAVKDEYSDVWLERLNDLQIYFCTDSLETEFVKFILARSPKLKKLTILTHLVDRKRKSKMLKTLLRAPCASEGVIIYHR